MTDPWLSVIIPMYNVASYVTRTLISIDRAVESLRRSLSEGDLLTVEIICIDDGSTDNSLTVVKSFSPTAEGLEIRVFSQNNAGVSCARNHGMDVAKGEWIAFIDGDDWWKEDLLVWLWSCLGRHPEVDAAGFGSEFVDDQGHVLSRYERVFDSVVVPAGDDVLLVGEYFDYRASACNKFFKRAVIEKSGVRFYPGLRNGEDTLFATQMLASCGPVFLEPAHVGYCYLVREASASHRLIRHMPEDPFCLFREMRCQWIRTPTPGLRRCLALNAAGILSLCREPLYAPSARQEAIAYLMCARQLRTEIWPFVLRHGWWRTKLVLTVFILGPRPIKRWVLRRFCGD